MPDPMTNDDDRRAAMAWLTQHPRLPLHEAFTAHRLLAERRGMERAAGICEQYEDTFIAGAIRAEAGEG